jgi:hypothetical protein
MKKNLTNILFTLLSIVITLVIAEFAFRWYTNKKVIYDIEMHKYAKKLKQRSSIPGLSHEHIPNASAKLMGVDIHINSLGFRDDELTAKAENEYRVLVAGQSITFGWGVPKDSTFCELSQNRLNASGDSIHYNFVNTGIGNYNTRLEYLYLKRNLPLVNPDMVVLHAFLRDAETIPPKSQNVLIANSYLAAYLYIKIQQAFFFNNKTYKTIGDYYLNMYSENSEGWKEQQQAFRDIRSLCEERRIPLLVVLQPDLNDLSEQSPQEKCYRIIGDFLSTNSFSYIDMSDIYRAKVSNPRSIWVSVEDSHPNSAGHTVVADELYRYFNSHPVSLNR